MMNIRQIRTTVSYETHFLCTNTKIPKWNMTECETHCSTVRMYTAQGSATGSVCPHVPLTPGPPALPS